jgi:hypothetical protein
VDSPDDPLVAMRAGLEEEKVQRQLLLDEIRLLGICFLREAPERAIGSDRPACHSLGEDWRAGKRGLRGKGRVDKAEMQKTETLNAERAIANSNQTGKAANRMDEVKGRMLR